MKKKKLSDKPVYQTFILQGKKWTEKGSVFNACGNLIVDDELTKALKYACGFGTVNYEPGRASGAGIYVKEILNRLASNRRNIRFENITIEPDVKNDMLDIYITFTKNPQTMIERREQWGIIAYVDVSDLQPEEKPVWKESEVTDDERIEWGRAVSMATEALSKRPRRSQVQPFKKNGKADEGYSGYNGIKSDYYDTTHRLRKTYGLDDDE